MCTFIKRETYNSSGLICATDWTFLRIKHPQVPYLKGIHVLYTILQYMYINSVKLLWVLSIDKCRSGASNIMAAIVHVYFFVFKTDKAQSLINRVSVQTILSVLGFMLIMSFKVKFDNGSIFFNST